MLGRGSGATWRPKPYEAAALVNDDRLEQARGLRAPHRQSLLRGVSVCVHIHVCIYIYI